MNTLAVLAPLETYFLVGLPIGLVAGALLSFVAARTDGWGGYGSESRRAARLGHVAAVMLPVIGAVYASRLAVRSDLPDWTSWAVGGWVGGGIALAAALFVVALRPQAKLLLMPPATVVIAASVALSIAAGGGA